MQCQSETEFPGHSTTHSSRSLGGLSKETLSATRTASSQYSPTTPTKSTTHCALTGAEFPSTTPMLPSYELGPSRRACSAKPSCGLEGNLQLHTPKQRPVSSASSKMANPSSISFFSSTSATCPVSQGLATQKSLQGVTLSCPTTLQSGFRAMRSSTLPTSPATFPGVSSAQNGNSSSAHQLGSQFPLSENSTASCSVYRGSSGEGDLSSQLTAASLPESAQQLLRDEPSNLTQHHKGNYRRNSLRPGLPLAVPLMFSVGAQAFAAAAPPIDYGPLFPLHPLPHFVPHLGAASGSAFATVPSARGVVQSGSACKGVAKSVQKSIPQNQLQAIHSHVPPLGGMPVACAVQLD